VVGRVIAAVLLAGCFNPDLSQTNIRCAADNVGNFELGIEAQ
jgi:hypothetical protein